MHKDSSAYVSKSGKVSSSEALRELECRSELTTTSSSLNLPQKKVDPSELNSRNTFYFWQKINQKVFNEEHPSSFKPSSNIYQKITSIPVSPINGLGLPTVTITPAYEKSLSPVNSSRLTPIIVDNLASNNSKFHSHYSISREHVQKFGRKSYLSLDPDDISIWTDDLQSSSRRSSNISSCTTFEENGSPTVSRPDQSVSFSREKISEYLRIDTSVIRRSSKGWWNYVLSPFLTSSESFADSDKELDDSSYDDHGVVKAEFKDQMKREVNARCTDLSSMGQENSQNDGSHLKLYLDTKVKRVTGKLPLIQSKEDNTRTTSIEASIYEFSETGSICSMIPLGDQELILSKENLPISKKATHLRPAMKPEPVIFSSTNNKIPSKYSHSESFRSFRHPTKIISSRDNLKTPETQVSSNLPLPSPYFFYTSKQDPKQSSKLLRPISTPQQEYLDYNSSSLLEITRPSNVQIPNSNIPLTPLTQESSKSNLGYSEKPFFSNRRNLSELHIQHVQKKKSKKPTKFRRNENKKDHYFSRFRSCLPDCRSSFWKKFQRQKKRQWWYLALFLIGLFFILFIVLLLKKLHKTPKKDVPQPYWLNLTDFPPIYLGHSTVISPILIKKNTDCVLPSTQWSCNLPKELQSSTRGDFSNRPNFFMQFDWDNSAEANSTFQISNRNRISVRQISGHSISARNFLRYSIIRKGITTGFIPTPPAPSSADGSFLGRTTDDIISTEKAGEPTPFYLSFIQSANSLVNRVQTSFLGNITESRFPNVSSIIPPPCIESDGTMCPANLVPFPSYQPIRLYDRGLSSEHYGFYNYFDRSIFLKSIELPADPDSSNGTFSEDLNGGSTKSEALFRCTWAQTRFLIQIWTRKNTTQPNRRSLRAGDSVNEETLQHPGTFPYPFTITIDRHGGDPLTKMLYCYKKDDQGGLVIDSGFINTENRGFGGVLINPAPTIFLNNSDPSLGGFDGGSSGCQCQWSNFEDSLDS